MAPSTTPYERTHASFAMATSQYLPTHPTPPSFKKSNKVSLTTQSALPAHNRQMLVKKALMRIIPWGTSQKPRRRAIGGAVDADPSITGSQSQEGLYCKQNVMRSFQPAALCYRRVKRHFSLQGFVTYLPKATQLYKFLTFFSEKKCRTIFWTSKF